MLDKEHRQRYPSWRPAAEVEAEMNQRATAAQSFHSASDSMAEGANHHHHDNDATSAEGHGANRKSSRGREGRGGDDEVMARAQAILERLGPNPTEEQLDAVRRELGPEISRIAEEVQRSVQANSDGDGGSNADGDGGDGGGDGANDSADGDDDDDDEKGPPNPAYVTVAEEVRACVCVCVCVCD